MFQKGSRDEAVFLAASPLVTAPPSNLTRLLHNTISYAGYKNTRTCCARLYINSLISFVRVIMIQ